MARAKPDVQRAVDFVAERLSQLPQPPASKASAPDSKLRVLLAKAGYRRATQRNRTDLQAAFDKQQIVCDPKITDLRTSRETRIYFFKDQLPGELAHDAELFPAEAHLEHFIEANYPLLAPFHGLELVKRQHALSPGKKIDLMFRDRKSRALVGVELKKGKPDDRTVGQIKGYLRELKVESDKQGLDYRLILITGQPDPDIDKTLREITNDHFEIWRYNVNLKLVQDKVDR
jgi:hypothetical protein